MFKIAMFSYVDNKGRVNNFFLTYGGINEQWRSDSNFIIFDAYASPDEYARGRNSIITSFNMEVTHEEVLSIFSKVGNVGDEISLTVWELAVKTPFIPDWSTINEDNQRVMFLKSLSDLKAQIIEI